MTGRIRLLWDRFTGQEAARAADDQRRWCEKIRASDRDNHAREIQQLRLAALDQGVWLYKAIETWVDVTTVEGEAWVPGLWQWKAVPIHESHVAMARDVIIGDTRDRC